tara:strand:+ start:19 stop:846 length:828 start_codon:yes stop_codon:yes gene_type:complete
MLLNHILLTFKDIEIKKSVKDLDQDDIIYKNINKIFKTKETYLQYYLKDSIYASLIRFQQCIYLGYFLLILLNYSESYFNSLFICCLIDATGIILSIYIDIWGKQVIESKDIENTELYKKSSLGLVFANILLLLYASISIIFFNNNYNMVYYYWINKLKMCFIGAVIGFMLGTIYSCHNHTFLKIKNKIEKVKKLLFNSYQHTEIDGYNTKVYDVIYLKTFKLKKNNDICAICRHDTKKDEYVTKLKCNHIYHKDCIKLWFNTEFTCPYCRKPVI